MHYEDPPYWSISDRLNLSTAMTQFMQAVNLLETEGESVPEAIAPQVRQLKQTWQQLNPKVSNGFGSRKESPAYT